MSGRYGVTDGYALEMLHREESRKETARSNAEKQEYNPRPVEKKEHRHIDP